MGICDAQEEVCNDKNDINWMLLTFADSKGSALTVSQKGAGGIDELKQHLKDDEAAFGYLRTTMSNDEHSQRTKFVLVSWIGKNVNYMRRARLGMQKSDVTKVLKYFSIDIPAEDPDDLDADDILMRLRKAGGANYDRQTSNY
ncbi:hypothetical protein EV183_003089 [Coemansia sp. RSA 2336]|nr:hypothetical protein EV183_003089 [Coemansia sp. RSA 2336]